MITPSKERRQFQPGASSAISPAPLRAPSTDPARVPPARERWQNPCQPPWYSSTVPSACAFIRSNALQVPLNRWDDVRHFGGELRCACALTGDEQLWRTKELEGARRARWRGTASSRGGTAARKAALEAALLRAVSGFCSCMRTHLKVPALCQIANGWESCRRCSRTYQERRSLHSHCH